MWDSKCFEFKHGDKFYKVECEYTIILTSYYPQTFYDPEEFETDIDITFLEARDKEDYERFVCNRELFQGIEQYLYSLPVSLNDLLRERDEAIVEDRVIWEE